MSESSFEAKHLSSTKLAHQPAKILSACTGQLATGLVPALEHCGLNYLADIFIEMSEIDHTAGQASRAHIIVELIPLPAQL